MLARFARVAALLLVVLLVGCGSDDDGGGGGGGVPPLGAGVVARIEISPQGALLVPGAPMQAFEAKAFDAENRRIEASFTWSSNAVDVVTVTSDGTGSARATAVKAMGSALVTAETGGMKATVFAIAAEPVAGAVLVADDQIVGLPSAVSPSAPFGPGFQYRMELKDVRPPTGAILLSTGGKTVAGRVVAADGAFVTVEQITLEEALPRLDIRQQLDLTQAPSDAANLKPAGRSSGLRPLASKELKLGPLDCELEGSIGSIELKKQQIAPPSVDSLVFDVAWNDNEKRIVVKGTPKVSFELEPVVKGQIDGKLNCKAISREFIIPLPGVLGIFLGAAVPVGVGFELGAKVVVNEAGVNLKGEAAGNLSFGFTCTAGNCTSVREVSSSGSLTPTWIPPDLTLNDLKFEPQAQVFTWARLEGGARFSSTLRFEAIEAQAGFKLAGSFASEQTQAKQADYASSYKLSFNASVGPKGALEGFLNLVKVAVAILQLETEVPIADSPAGLMLRASPPTFKTGETVTFDLALDPKKLEFPVVGYNVESVRIYRKETRPDGTLGLILANEAVAAANQSSFKIPWVATVDGSAQGTFVAFVKTKLLDLRLDAGTSATLGELTTAGGVTLPATDGFSTVVPPNTPDFNPTAMPLAVGKFFFAQFADGVLVCGKQQERAQMGYVELAFAQANALAPGTYTYAPSSAPLAPGTFTGQAVANGVACVRQSADFIGGTIVLTEATPTSFVGTVSLQSSNGTSTGTMNIPACPKSFADVKSLSLICIQP